MCYNIAFNYLGKKYGLIKLDLVPSVREKLRKARNKKEVKEIESNISEEDYIYTLNIDNIPETICEDRAIYLLLTQYNYGITPKNELKELLISMKIM